MTERRSRFGQVLLGWMFVSLGAIPLSGCETMSTNEAIGTGLGALLGGVAGSQFGSGSGQTAATIGGVVLGGMVGNVIGKRMDENDRKKMSQALDTNAPGQPSAWKNETTGANYTITPSKSFVQDGRQCRGFVQEAIIDGQPKKISGTACKRQDSATWEETA